MNEIRPDGLDLRTATPFEVAEAITRGVRRALAIHKRLGKPVVVRDPETGHTVTVPPEEIPDEMVDWSDLDQPAGDDRSPVPDRS